MKPDKIKKRPPVNKTVSRSRVSISLAVVCFLALASQIFNWKVNTKTYDGIETLLNALANAGIKMAILSNKPHRITEECVVEMLADWHFEIVFGQREGVPKKPDATGALEIARAMDIPPEAFLYLGDTKIDMITANRAGMYAVGASWGFRPREELIRAGAKSVINKPIELLDLLK